MADDFIAQLEDTSRTHVKLTMVTHWVPNDGDYSKSLLTGVGNRINATILASATGSIGEWQRPEFVKCSTPYENITPLLEITIKREFDVVHIHFNFGLFQVSHLAELIKAIKDYGGRRESIMDHLNVMCC